MKRFAANSKREFSKRYQRRIEEAERKHEKHITGDSPKRLHYWPMPKGRADLRELKQQLRARLLEGEPNCPDYEWTHLKLEEAEDALRGKDAKLALGMSIAVLIVAIASVVVGII